MFPLVVEAVEVTAGSEYQCNITAAISDLGTVKQGSFIHCCLSVHLITLKIYSIIILISDSDGFQFCGC